MTHLRPRAGLNLLLVLVTVTALACGSESQARSSPTSTSTPTPSAGPQLFRAPVESMSIPAIGVASAPLVPMGVRDGYMDLPYSPHEIAWYEFTAKPGMGGNGVFSAHLDYIGYGPAVFADLHMLREGAEVSVRLRDGTQLRYAVTENETRALADLDMASLLGPTPEEVVTLITCAGDFDGQDYSHRVIVRARRVGA